MASAVQSIDYTALLPTLITSGGALAVLVADLFLERGRKRILPWATAVILLAALGAETALWIARTAVPRETFCLPSSASAAVSVETGTSLRLCSYSVDNFSLTLQTLLLGASLLVVLMAANQYKARARYKAPSGEYHFLLLCSLTGGLVLVAARDFITLTVALETLSLPAFALVGFGRRAGGEAALKFFLMSIASTAVMLFGISLVYGVTGGVFFNQVQAVITGTGYHASLFGVAAVLTLAGFAFKISAVPFHFWTPEVYSGAPVPVAAYLSVVSKAAGFAGLILTFDLAFRAYLPDLGVLIAVLAAVTMTVGNLVALRQRRVVRLLAWSTVAQAGYVLVPLAVTRWNGRELSVNAVVNANQLGPAVAASIAYLVLYAVMNLGAFGVVSALTATSGPGRSADAASSGAGGLGSAAVDGGAGVAGADPFGELTDYQGLGRSWPRAALPLAFFLLCLAGLPPGIMGLFAKVTVFQAAMSGGLVWLAVIMAVNVVIALSYYLRWAASLYFGPEPAGQAATATAAGGAPAATGAAAAVAAPDGGSGSAGSAVGPLVPEPGTGAAAVRIGSGIPLAPRIAVGLALVLAVALSVYPNVALNVLNH